jgi:hypothetical protein
MWQALATFIANLLGKELDVAVERQRAAKSLAKEKERSRKALAASQAQLLEAEGKMLEQQRKHRALELQFEELNERAMKLDRERIKQDVPENPY